MKSNSIPFLASLGALLLAGCAMGPDYQRPATPVPEAYDNPTTDQTNQWKVAEPADGKPRGSWWQSFGDAELNHLEVEAAASNQDLKSALARFEEAREQLNISRSGYFPHVTLTPYVDRQRDSANRPINGVSSGNGKTYNVFNVPLDASYEVDLWGGVRRSVEASRAALKVQEAQLESVRLSIQSELASDYFTLLALDDEIALLNSSIEVFKKSLTLTINRRAGGIATDLDVAQAETILKTTEAQLPVIRLERVKAEHALAVLTGRMATGFAIASHSASSIQPPLIPAQVPSALLERRPDIAAAERSVAEANAKIGIAKSAFYPNLQLNATGGFESVSIGTLFSWPSRLWSIGPSLTLPIFQGGSLRGNLRLTKAAYEETVARYRQAVISAFANVEDNLASQNLLSEEYEAQVTALKAARRTLDIANNRYRAGLVTFLEVATAENAALDLEHKTVQLHGERLVAAVSLVKSLGGDWHSHSTDKSRP